MWTFWRREAPPAQLRAMLERRERLLTVAGLVDGGYAAASDRALLLAGAHIERRVPWQRVAAASWDEDAQVLTVEEVRGGAPALLHRLQLSGASLLPETVRERVTASIVVTEHVPLVGKAGVRIVARRSADGDLAWQLLFDRGADPADPDVRARAERALEDLRRSTGA